MFFFGREREDVQVPTKYLYLYVSFVIAYSITDSSVDPVVGFNRIFYFKKVGEMKSCDYACLCKQRLRYGLKELHNW